MTRYVVGFAFDQARKNVALIRKKRPEWQAGKLNGIEGHVEKGESPEVAMAREFEEEAGLWLPTWKRFVEYQAKDYIVYFFYTITHVLGRVETMTDEDVNIYTLEYLNSISPNWPKNETIPNLKWLIPLALDKNVKMSTITEK